MHCFQEKSYDSEVIQNLRAPENIQLRHFNLKAQANFAHTDLDETRMRILYGELCQVGETLNTS